MKTDSELRWVGFQVLFKLMRRAVAQSKVAVVADGVGVGVMGHFQAGFSGGGEGRAGSSVLLPGRCRVAFASGKNSAEYLSLIINDLY